MTAAMGPRESFLEINGQKRQIILIVYDHAQDL